MARYAAAQFVERAHGRANLARRAIAALITIVFDESSLQRVKAVGRAPSLDGGDFCTFMHDRQRQAPVDSPVINNDRTSTALTVIATFFDAGQVKCFSRRVQQGRAGLQR